MDPDQDPLHGKLSDHRDDTVELLEELVVFRRNGLGLCHLVPGCKGDWRRTGLARYLLVLESSQGRHGAENNRLVVFPIQQRVGQHDSQNTRHEKEEEERLVIIIWLANRNQGTQLSPRYKKRTLDHVALNFGTSETQPLLFPNILRMCLWLTFNNP